MVLRWIARNEAIFFYKPNKCCKQSFRRTSPDHSKGDKNDRSPGKDGISAILKIGGSAFTKCPTVNVTMDDTAVENLTKYVYFGHLIKYCAENQSAEVKTRFRIIWVAVGKLEVTLKIMTSLYQIQRAIDRHMLGTSLRDRITNK